MPEVDNQGIGLSYDVRGSGRPLILLHGWNCDRGWWDHAGFVADLAHDHRLVNVDLRGHGRSSKPHDPAAYTSAEVVGDVLAVADAEGLGRFSIWGLSYGGWIGWLTGAAHPERVAALVTSGAWDPRPEPREELQEWWDIALAPLRQGGTAADVAHLKEALGERYQDVITDWMEASFLAADSKALLAIQDPSLWDQGLRSLEDYPVPALLISGALEDPDNKAGAVAATIPRGESLSLPGLSHAPACAASALSVPTARAFLDRWDPQPA